MDVEKFLVIGSNSFSGAYFVRHVLLNHANARVVGISRSDELPIPMRAYHEVNTNNNFQFHQLDLNQDFDKVQALIDFEQPEYIVNFAAQGMVGQSWANPGEWFATNTIAIMNLANFLKDKKFLKRYVHVSSPEVYGSCVGKILENHPLSPTTPYAASKAGGDLSLMPFIKAFNLPVIYTRATNVYGPWQQLYRIIPRTMLNLTMGKKLNLDGGGKAQKSFIHIDDVCSATLKLALHGTNGEIYHISPDASPISIHDLVLNICEMFGKDFSDSVTFSPERLGQDACYEIDSSKIRQELGWKPTVNLLDGLFEVKTWILDNFEQLKQLPLEYVHKA